LSISLLPVVARAVTLAQAEAAAVEAIELITLHLRQLRHQKVLAAALHQNQHS
jgi:hypothetical protein